MEIHNYHLLITDDLRKGVCNIEELNYLSFSSKINFILENINNIFYVLKNNKIDEKSKVEYLHSQSQTHIYMKIGLYRKIKSYHSHYNSYSMAALVRMLVKVFINMVGKYGFNNALKKIRKVGQKIKRVFERNNNKYTMVQLLRYLDLKECKNIKLEIILVKLLL